MAQPTMRSELFHTVRERFETTPQMHEFPYARAFVIVLLGYWIASKVFEERKIIPGAPTAGYKSMFEPTFWLQTRFITNANDILREGFQKFKDVPFVVRRYDIDTTIMPMRYLKEIRLMPSTKLSGRLAQVGNLVPKWTGVAFMMESNLHFKVVMNKLTPDLWKYMDLAKAEVDYGFPIDVPQPKEWAEVDIQNIIRMLVARMSAKAFVGSQACKNMEWLRISIDFSIDTFTVAFLLRLLPTWSYPVAAYLIPARYRQQAQLRAARAIVKPLIEAHEDAVRRRAMGEVVEEEDTMLNWMLDHGTAKEKSLEQMADRQCILTLASIHTTSMSVSNLLFDLCENPQYFNMVREEIDEVTQRLGKIGENPNVGLKEWLGNLEKLDSLFMESQRLHPPVLLNPARVAVEDITFKDGLTIPKGIKIAFLGHEHQNDPAITTNPNIFDPLRNYRKRQASPETATKFVAGTVDQNNLGFGWGAQACPGRFFAVAEIKLLVAIFLSQFEFDYVPGKDKPKTMYAAENLFLDPSATIMMRQRMKH